MNRKRLIWFFALIFLLPIILNWVLRIPLCSVIGGSHSEEIWLSFWANYGGSIVSGIISLYILYYTVKDNHDRLLYEHKKKDLNEETERLTKYLQNYDLSYIRSIYDYYLMENIGDKNSLYKLGEWRRKVNDGFYQFIIHYSEEEKESIPFLKQQMQNHKSINRLLDDLQIAISQNKTLWSNIGLQIDYIGKFELNTGLHSDKIIDILRNSKVMNEGLFIKLLLNEYNEINYIKICIQIQDYLKDKRMNVERIYK